MAVCINGMTEEETAALTDAMKNSGEVLSLGLDKFCVDKHSTGGVGDKITLFAAPVCASCGVYVPKMSGSGLGKTGGTIDKLAAIPGLRTDLEYEDFKALPLQDTAKILCLRTKDCTNCAICLLQWNPYPLSVPVL